MQTISLKRLRQLVMEDMPGQKKTPTVVRTRPFVMSKVVLLPKPVYRTFQKDNGQVIEKLYDRIDVYNEAGRSEPAYYIWTKHGNGQTVVNRLKRDYCGKTVTAKMGFDRGRTIRISPVGIQVVKPKVPNTADRPVEIVDEPEQLEFDF